MEKIIVKAEIMSPIHIRSGDEYDRLDYFFFDWWESLQLVDQKWLENLSTKDEQLFNNVLSVIKQWNFREIENCKMNYYEDFLDETYIKWNIDISEKASKQLLMKGGKNNQWIIKKQFQNKFTWESIIPGSTLKWIIRTIFLCYKMQELNWTDCRRQERELKTYDNKILKELFKNIYLEDVLVEDSVKNIQYVQWVNKRTESTWQVKGIPMSIESIVKGKFDINITNFFKDKSHSLAIDKTKLLEMIKFYSKLVISREEQILENIGIHTDYIDELNWLYNQWKYPIKIGMFKKSITYKIFWEDMIEDIYYYDTQKHKNIMDLNKARKLWVWDKSIYLDENNTPVWWIVLSF